MLDDENTKDLGSIKGLIRTLAKNYDVLMSAGSDHALLRNYLALLKFLRTANTEEINRIFHRTTTRLPRSTQLGPQYEDSAIANFSITQVEQLLNDNATPRKLLERIAIKRFNVPAGSMRSFSNRRMLVEKLATLIHSEQAHSTIDTVARR